MGRWNNLKLEGSMENNIITREELEFIQMDMGNYLKYELGIELTKNQLKKLSTMFIMWSRSDIDKNWENPILKLYGI